MKRFVFTTVLLMTLVAGAAEVAAQMGTGRASGTVKDTDGNPIEGAQIIAERDGRELTATADKKGRWAILGFRTGTYTFTFSANGYQPQSYKARMKQTGKNPTMNVVLERVQMGQAAGGSQAGTLLQEGNELFEQENYSEAVAKYQQLLEENPTLYQVHLNIGAAYRKMGETDRALEEYALVLNEEPFHSAALVSTGDILVQQGDLEKAVEFFEKAIEQAPEDEILPFNVAEIYFNTGNTEKAIEYYQKAGEVKPDWSEPYLKLGYAYLNVGDMDKAAEAFQKVVEVAPDSAQAQIAQAALDSLKKD